MDFSAEIMQTSGSGRYTELDPGILPPLYLAYNTLIGIFFRINT